jgi:hypothetical protein
VAQKQPLANKPSPTAGGRKRWADTSRAGKWFLVTVLGAAVAAPVGTLATRALGGDDRSRPPETTNTLYLAELVERGPFTETLPAPLVPDGLAPVNLSDPATLKKLGAAQLKIKTPAKDEFAPASFFAHMEVYPTEADALERGGASMKDLSSRFYDGRLSGTPANFCLWAVHGSSPFWTCAGVSKFVYAEVTVSPNDNATQHFATDTVTALLRYCDRMTQLATK